MPKSNYMQKVFFILLSSLFFCSINSTAQYYNFQEYTVEDGLPQSQVFTLYQDNRSSLWLGTNGGGLARFNGNDFEVYGRKDGLLSDLIVEITGDDGGNLVIKTNLGISIFNGNEFKNYPFPNGNLLFSDNLWKDKNGHFWFRVFQNDAPPQIYKFDGERYHFINDQYEELKEITVQNHLITDGEGNVLISAGENLYQIIDEEISLHPINDFPEVKGKIKSTMHLTVEKDILVVTLSNKTDGKAYLYNPDTGLRDLNIPKKISNEPFSYFYEDKGGNFWLLNPEKEILYRWDRLSGDNSVERFKSNSGLPITTIRCVLEDEEGNIWIGTDGNGLFKYGGTKFISFLSSQNLEDYFIWSISQDQEGNYWFGTADQGILKYDGNSLINYKDLEKEPLGIIREIIEYKDGFLIGSSRGIWQFNGKSIKRINDDFDIPQFAGVNDIYLSDDRIWFATVNNGIYYHDGNQTINFNTSSSDLGSNSVDDILIDDEGVIWFATRGGISRYKNGEIKNFVNNEYGLYAIMQITKDDSGYIWAATYGGGVCRVFIDENDEMHVEKIDTDSGLTSNNVYSILTDEKGQIWAGCQRGVDKIITDKDGKIIEIRNYDNFEGFIGYENNGKANFIDKDGQLWFGTIKGAMVYNPVMDIVNDNPPKTNITKLKLFYKDVEWSSEDYNSRYDQLTLWTGLPENLQLPYNKNHLSFEFEGLNYTVPEKVQFQWKLEGVDSEWAPPSSRTDAAYTNLSPGNYTFMVRAGNSDGIWNEVPASFSFVIKPPFWGTWWFRGMVLLFLVTIVLIVFWLKNKFVKEKREELEQLVAFKTKKLERQKSEILEKNEALKTQYENLELLSNIGRDITANITIESLLESVYQKLNSLMDASIMGFGILDSEKRVIDFPSIISKGRKIDEISVSYDEKYSLAVRCLKENEEIVIHDFKKEFEHKPEFWNAPLKGKKTVSIVFMPLVYSDRPLGILTVQSSRKNAYTEYHLNILRNLAIYAKIALENTNAYEKIQDQRNQLSLANQDISRQKSEIESSNRKLIELNDEKNNIIGIVAHDLKNPLTSAFTMANILKSDSDSLEEEQKQCVEVIEKSVNRMNNMINRLLDIRKIEDKISELKLEKVNLVKIITDVNSNLSNEISRKKINLCFDAEDLYAHVDPDYAVQVFENLISNAIKFSPPQKEVRVKLGKENGKARAEIIDEGPGLTAEDMKKVFGKFQRLSAKPTGGEHSTGLGLSIVKKYVEAMNGKVWCESEFGKGANFIVEFTRVD